MFDFDNQIADVEQRYTPVMEEAEGLLPPRKTTLCLGHTGIEKTLLNLINSGAMPHALIFSGQQGIGKATMAFRLARYLLKNGVPDDAQDSLFGDAPVEATSLDVPHDDPIFSRVVSGGHPDLLTIERAIDSKKGTQKNTLDVETARKVAPFLRMTSSDGGWRVVIIDDADTMNRNAQNAMLKILEEPPKNTLLILLCHRLGAMIPTIRSRCRVLHFDPLNHEDFSALLQKEIGNMLSTEDQNLLKILSQGSMGQAQEIINSNGLETAHQVLEIVKNWQNFNGVDIHHLADQAGRAGQNNSFIMIEKTFLSFVEQIVFGLAGQGFSQKMLDNQSIIQSQKTLHDWLQTFDNLKAHFIQVSQVNLDKRQGVIGAFNILLS